MIFLNPSKTKLVPRSLSKCAFSLCGWLLPFFALAAPIKSNKAKILPLITYYSSLQDGEVYNWWAENNSLGDMKNLSEKIHAVLLSHPLSRWEYVSAAEMQKEAEPVLAVSALTAEQKMELAKKKSAVIVISGDVRVSPSPVILKGVRLTQNLTATRVKNSEKIAETLKIVDIPSHQFSQMLLSSEEFSKDFVFNSFSDLHDKIETYRKPPEVLKKSRLVLTGALSYHQLEAFKQKLKQRMPLLRSFQTQSLEREQVVLIAEGVDGEDLGLALGFIQWSGWRTQVVSTDSSQVVFDVKAKNSVQ